jgi:hypothetical protein
MAETTLVIDERDFIEDASGFARLTYPRDEATRVEVTFDVEYHHVEYDP